MSAEPVVVLVVVLISLGVACISAVPLDTDVDCPGLYERVFKNSLPRANLSAGVYSAYGAHDGTITLRDCVLACCVESQCNVALLADDGDIRKCYHITCSSNDLCLPQPSGSDHPMLTMVLVRPVGQGSAWADMLLHYTPQQSYQDAVGSLWRMAEDDSSEQHTKMDYYSSELLDRLDYSTVTNNDGVTMNSDLRPTTVEPKLAPRILRVSVDSKQVQLPENNVTLVALVHELDPNITSQYQYEWLALQQPDDGQTGAIRSQLDNRLELSHLTHGLYMFNVTVSRVGGGGSGSIGGDARTASGWALANVTVLGAVRVNKSPEIVITPTNQTVRLPNTAAILDASATTDDIDTDNVQFHWELQQGPLGYQPTLATAATLQLSDLTRPGQYTFQLTAADSEGAQSQALAFITVLAPIDYPPTADAGPDQVLYLPLNDGELVLRGNLSTDDHDIVSWEWTRMNSVAAAASGNGTGDQSGVDSSMQAVDMRDTRTPTLRLGRIVAPGVYTFQLRVGDVSNQTSTAQVRLFVKEEQQGLRRPLAIVSSGNGSVTLPDGQTWVMLDGSKSTTIAVDDSQDNADSAAASASPKSSNVALYYKWDTLHTPIGSSIASANINTPRSASTNVTGLTTAGLYQFRLQVSTSPFDINTSSDISATSTDISAALVNATVTRAGGASPSATRMPPQAVAQIADGGNGASGNTVQLPRNAIYLNASHSRSSASGAIVSYRWRPCSDSSPLTVLPVAEGTDQHPVLVLLVGGSQLPSGAEEPEDECWNVTVQDSNGLTDWQALSFTILPDVMLEYLVELVVGVPKDLTATDYKTLIDSLEGISTTSMQVHVRSGVGGIADTVLLTVYATAANTNATAFIAAEELAARLLEQRAALAPRGHLLSVRPVSCRSVRCSGHGRCDARTRTCRCHPLWMHSLLWLLDGSSSFTHYDCSWSVLYVTLAAVFCASAVTAGCWRCCRCGRGHVRASQELEKLPAQKQRHHQTRRSRGSRNHSYTLIDSVEVSKQRGKLSDSDDSDRLGSADSDDNVVFNSLNNKLLPNNSALRVNNLNKLSFKT